MGYSPKEGEVNPTGAAEQTEMEYSRNKVPWGNSVEILLCPPAPSGGGRIRSTAVRIKMVPCSPLSPSPRAVRALIKDHSSRRVNGPRLYIPNMITKMCSLPHREKEVQACLKSTRERVNVLNWRAPPVSWGKHQTKKRGGGGRPPPRDDRQCTLADVMRCRTMQSHPRGGKLD